jgi:PilZ domain
MVETRVAPRFRVTKPAIIDHGGDKIDCVVRDISTTGAAIEISDVVRIPDYFVLSLPEDRLKLPCHVVWRTQYRIGVAFD